MIFIEWIMSNLIQFQKVLAMICFILGWFQTIAIWISFRTKMISYCLKIKKFKAGIFKIYLLKNYLGYRVRKRKILKVLKCIQRGKSLWLLWVQKLGKGTSMGFRVKWLRSCLFLYHLVKMNWALNNLIFHCLYL